MPLRRLAACLMLAGFAWALAPAAAGAQPLVGRIVASVNDEAVTDYDLDARARLISTSTSTPITAENRDQIASQALRELIDDRLKTQEAQRLDITVSDQEVQAAIQSIERGNQMEPGGLFQMLDSNGVPVDALIDQVTATLLWRKVLRRRVLPNVRVAEEEIDDALARIRAAGGDAVARAAEIFLPAGTPEQAAEARELARQIAAGAPSSADFARLAAQYSRAPTAAVGGDLGEIAPGQLEPELETALGSLSPGQTSEPIETERGVYLLHLISRRDVAAGEPNQAVVTLARAVTPIRPGEAAAERAQALQNAVAGIDGCDDFERAARSVFPTQPPRVVDARIGDLPPDMRAAVEGLQPGEQTAPIQVEDAVAILMLCRRAEAGSGLPSAERVAEAIQNQRAQRLAERYLRDLRRLAFIDVRG